MYRHILVPTAGQAGDAATWAAALQVARLSGAHIEFLHVRADVTESLMALTTGGMGGGAAVQEVVDRLEAEVKAAETRVWEAFGAFCERENIPAEPREGEVSAELVVETGPEAQWIAEYGRFADLIVIGRAAEAGLGTESLEAALMDTGRPLLIVPGAGAPALPGTVVIAWKDTPEAARAVSSAMPLIDRASEVIIVSVAEGSAPREDTALRLQRSLRWHNPRTSVRTLAAGGRAPVDVLMAEATATGAGLVVMGGYSHSRLREVVFGGFTQRVLAGAELAVLIAH